MREQVERLTKLTADLLDLSKLDADVLQVNAERVDLGELAGRVAEEFGPAAERHGSPIEVNGDRAAMALADPDRVAQIMRILVDNALTHTPQGTSISIEAQRRDGAAKLVVKDDGPGIDPHVRARVFDRFYTGDRVSGSGLGLAIARELALLMDGELGLASNQGRTEFTLRLPVGVAEGATSVSRRRAALGALLASAALALGACGGDDSGAAGSETTVASSDNPQKTVVVQSRSGAFDPEAVYQQAAPGVVTIRSIFSGGGTSLLGGGGGSAAQGSGFVISDGWRDRDQRPRRHRRIGRGRPDPRGEGGLRPVRRPQPGGGRHRRLRPARRRRAAQGRPGRPRPAPTPAGDPRGGQGRTAGGSDRQPVRRGPIALGRGRLGHESLDPVADRLPDRRRDPDRRLDQPRQLGRPVARCRGPA